MNASEKPDPQKSVEDRQPGAGGPTSPGAPDDKAVRGPKTGGYDDHSPDKTSSNEKGGYGTG